MYYQHNLQFDYPERCDEHMLTVKRCREVNIDESYPYLQKSFWFKCQRVFYWIMQNAVIFWLLRITHGLKIYGKKNLKKHKAALKNGAITISNHVFMWDYLCVLKAIRPHLAYFPAWKDNLEGSFGRMIRMSGGIPIPTHNIHAMIKFNLAMEEALESGKWMHFYPEGSLWFYYPDIRPLKKSVFRLSVQYNRPIIPMAYSFRPRKGIAKLFGKSPLATLTIGEPLIPNTSLPKHEAIDALHKKAYHVLQGLAGITPDMENYRVSQDEESYIKTM